MNDQTVTGWGLKQIQAHGWNGYFGFALLGAVIGYVIGWFVTLQKTKVEISKIREEARKASGDNIEKLAQMRDAATSKRQVLDMAQQNMRDALLANNAGQNNVEKLRQCRDEMCGIYQNEYLPTVNTYVELIPRLSDKNEALIRAKTELIPGLETICRFLNMVNMEAMLKKIPGSQPFKLNRAGRDGLLLRIKVLVSRRHITLHWKMRQFRKTTDAYLRK